MLEPFAAWLGSLATVEIIEYLGKLAIIVVAVLWLLETDDRIRLENHEAWRVITAARGAGRHRRKD